MLLLVVAIFAVSIDREAVLDSNTAATVSSLRANNDTLDEIFDRDSTFIQIDEKNRSTAAIVNSAENVMSSNYTAKHQNETRRSVNQTVVSATKNNESVALGLISNVSETIEHAKEKNMNLVNTTAEGSSNQTFFSHTTAADGNSTNQASMNDMSTMTISINSENPPRQSVTFGQDEKHGINETSSRKGMSKYLDRGANFWFAQSGCAVSVWVFNGGPRTFRDCADIYARNIEGRMHLVQANDTVYVPTKLISSFFFGPMVNLTVPIVVLSGQYQYQRANRLSKKIIRQFARHPLLMKWFVQNPDLYLNGGQIRGPRFKISTLPFGLQKNHYDPHNPKPKPGVVFREAFMRHIQLPEKTRGIMYGYINPATSVTRQSIPSGEYLSLDKYYDELAQSRFVVSPGGDRPDCYRNYEALAFGAIPITNLNPAWYSFFQDGPIVYSTTDWMNLTEAIVLSHMNINNFSIANRNMVFEEYWLEYADRVTEMPLRWWDRIGQRAAYLDDFVNFTVSQ